MKSPDYKSVTEILRGKYDEFIANFDPSPQNYGDDYKHTTRLRNLGNRSRGAIRMSYNHNRPYEQREKRFSELSQKQVNKDAADTLSSPPVMRQMVASTVTTRLATITTSTLSAQPVPGHNTIQTPAITSAGSSKPRSSLRRWMSDEV